MIRPLLCILLGTGPFAAGVGPGVAAAGTDVSWGPNMPADTSLAFALDARRSDRWSRAQADSRFLGRAGLDTLGYLTTSLVERTREPGQTPLQHGRQARPTSSGPVADPNLWGANGTVLDMARSENTLYIAGAFRSVGENSGGFVPVDAQTGEALRPFPKVAGSVNVIIPDGAGGWYIGGEFTGVGGKPRSCLAQVLADGSVSDWNPSVTGSPGYITPPSVSALAVRGDRVYIGGEFREIGGLSRVYLGCVDAKTGAVLAWDPGGLAADARIGALAIHENTVFVGGWFFSVGGQQRSCLAAVDAITGEVMPWHAD